VNLQCSQLCKVHGEHGMYSRCEYSSRSTIQFVFCDASCSIVRLETIRNRPADCVAYSIQAKVSSVETILDSFASKGGAVI